MFNSLTGWSLIVRAGYWLVWSRFVQTLFALYAFLCLQMAEGFMPLGSTFKIRDSIFYILKKD